MSVFVSCLMFHSFFIFDSYVHHRDLHSFPTRRSSDLVGERITGEQAQHGLVVLQQFCDEVHDPRVIPVIVHRGKPHLPDRKSTRLNSSHITISYAVFCLKKKTPSSRIVAALMS